MPRHGCTPAQPVHHVRRLLIGRMGSCILGLALVSGSTASAAADTAADVTATPAVVAASTAMSAAAAGSATMPMSSARADLMSQAQRLLLAGEADRAADAFERAGYMEHAPDADIGMVRAAMQAGRYRQALVVAAHAAGGHPDEPDGVALYAWLLYLGGQDEVARRLLATASARLPQAVLLSAVRDAMAGGASGMPVAFHPVSLPAAPPSGWTVIGSAVLVDAGRHALVPASILGARTRLVLRNGLGQWRSAEVARRIDDLGIVVLRLVTPLPLPADMRAAPSDPFPGAIAYTVEATGAGGEAATWPLLRAGFLGAPIATADNPPARALGIDLPPGNRGGAVFDQAGRLTGMSLPARGASDAANQGANTRANTGANTGSRDAGTDRRDRFLPVGPLRALLGPALQDGPAAPGPGRATADQVYESGLRLSLQVLAAP